MKTNKLTNRNIQKRSGFTLVEIIVAIIANMIVISGVGILLIGGERSWQKCYNSANHNVKQDALATTLAFGNIGRKSNRLCYTIYEQSGNTFSPSLPITRNPEEIVYGDAVEFRYWDEGLDSTDSQNYMDPTKTATAYAFFYVDETQLKVDYGPYPPGAVSKENGRRNNTGIVTKVLAENVSLEESQNGIFSHTTLNGIGQGSVRINIYLNDSEDSESVRILTSVYLRNIWPR